MDPPQRPRNAQQKISSAEWDSHFQTIRKLFLTDGYTLSDVRSIMERDYKFHATVAQYKKKTKAWKIEKNLPQRKIIPMIRKQDRRLAEGKPTTFFFQGQPVSSEKLERARKRFEKETAAELHPDSPIPGKCACAITSRFCRVITESISGFLQLHRQMWSAIHHAPLLLNLILVHRGLSMHLSV
ncbi:hypothetical protein K440DRAFT_133701 [Wilcoxina mikolae CBS 423.85]|nr:hypothetical protein K440DRAFT_133701 [Wilcoxina mikolae CBS 423.85]